MQTAEAGSGKEVDYQLVEIRFSDEAMLSLSRRLSRSYRFRRDSLYGYFSGIDPDGASVSSVLSHSVSINLQATLLKAASLVALTEAAIDWFQERYSDSKTSDFAEQLAQKEFEAVEAVHRQSLLLIERIAQSVSGSESGKSRPRVDIEDVYSVFSGGDRGVDLRPYFDFLEVEFVSAGRGSGFGAFIRRFAQESAAAAVGTVAGGVLLGTILTRDPMGGDRPIPPSVEDTIERHCGNNITIRTLPPELLSEDYANRCAMEYRSYMSLYDDDPTGSANVQYALSVVLNDDDPKMRDGEFGGYSSNKLEQYRRLRGLTSAPTPEVLDALSRDLVASLSYRNQIAEWPYSRRS